jgi:hypothetical protein
MEFNYVKITDHDSTGGQKSDLPMFNVREPIRFDLLSVHSAVYTFLPEVLGIIHLTS